MYLIYVFAAYIAVTAAGYWLEYLKLSYLRKYGSIIPSEFEGQIDQTVINKVRDYTIDTTKFGIVSSGFNNIVVILFFFAGVLNIYNSRLASMRLSFIISGIVFFLLLYYADTVLTIPFTLYQTFRLEKRYEFNTMTLRVWIVDLIKSLLITTILLLLIISAGLWLIKNSPEYWWLWVWLFFFSFTIFMMYISPYVIEPLFNKFSPVDDDTLKEGINNLTGKVGIKISKVLKMDASKRTKHTNAYFTGIGRVKRVILYDTLVEKMSTNEILSVLAHELGHWKKRHILKHLILIESISLIVLYISFRLMQGRFLPNLFNINNDTFFVKIIILGFLGTIVSFPFTPLFNLLSKRHEISADAFSCRLTGNKESMISALVKLSKDNLSNLHPHPVYAMFYYSHPPVTERIKYIKRITQ